MKKILVVMLCAALLLSVTACAKKEEAKYKTVGECLDVTTDDHFTYYDDVIFVYAFDDQGTPARITADMTPELLEQIEALDFQAEDYDDQYKKLVGQLAIKTYEDLSQYVIKQEELDKNVGKTGQELIDAGFEVVGFGWGGGDECEFDLEKDMFQYHVVTDVPEGIEDEDFDGMEHFSEVTVKSMSYLALSFRSTDLPVEDSAN